jgi:hypothetical protein
MTVFSQVPKVEKLTTSNSLEWVPSFRAVSPVEGSGYESVIGLPIAAVTTITTLPRGMTIKSGSRSFSPSSHRYGYYLHGRICTGHPSAAQVSCEGAATICGGRRFTANTVLFKIPAAMSPEKTRWISLA